MVLIVGAGPTGLVLAIWLRRKNIPFRIVDKSPKPGLTSRALAVQARTLEFYRMLGIEDEVVQAGIHAKQIILRRKGRAVATGQLGTIGLGQSPFPYVLFLSQDVHEKILVEKLEQLGVEVEREVELLEFTEREDQVTATLKKNGKPEAANFTFVCGCDGAHSSVRRGLNLDFHGGTYSQVFFVADVEATGSAAEGGVQISVSQKDFCIVMPIEKLGSVRLTGIVPPEVETREKIEFDDVRESVRENTGLTLRKVNWFSTYHVHHRVAAKFRVSRCFLAGDAAHIHSPAGGQGMNTGIGDAVALAWRIDAVMRGGARDLLLDSYESERMGFARVLVATTDRAFKVIASRGWLGSIWRAYLMPTVFALLTQIPGVMRRVFRAVSQIRIRYPNSPLSQGSTGQLKAGDRLPWVQVAGGDNFLPLKSLDWQIHIYGKVSPHFRETIERWGLALHEFEFSADAQDKGLRQNAVYVVRPDGYVGMATTHMETAGIKDYLVRVLGRVDALA